MNSVKAFFKKLLLPKSNPSGNDSSKESFMTKVLSVVIALVLWIYVIGEVNPETTQDYKNIQVNLVNTDQLSASGLILKDQDDFFVNIKVEGRMSDISSLTAEEIHAVADLRGFSRGENNVPVEVVLPSSLSLKEVKPSKIKVSIDQIAQTRKSVEVEYIGMTATGFINSTPIISTPEIVITGPKTYVDAIDKVIALINLENASSDITRKVPFTLLDKDGHAILNVTTDIQEVEISVPILNVKTVPILISTEGVPASGYELISIEAIPKGAQVIGSAEVLAEIENLTADTISLGGLSFTQTIPLNISIPEGAEIKTTSVPIVKVFIEKIVSKKLSYDIREVNFKGLKDSTKATFLNKENITLTVTAAESVINSLSKTDIPLSIDVTGLDYGAYTLPISIASGDNYKSVSLDSPTIEITLLENKSAR